MLPNIPYTGSSPRVPPASKHNFIAGKKSNPRVVRLGDIPSIDDEFKVTKRTDPEAMAELQVEELMKQLKLSGTKRDSMDSKLVQPVLLPKIPLTTATPQRQAVVGNGALVVPDNSNGVSRGDSMSDPSPGPSFALAGPSISDSDTQGPTSELMLAVPTSPAIEQSATEDGGKYSGKDIVPQRVTGFSKEQHVRYLETYIGRHGGSTKSVESRTDTFCRVLDAVCDMHPSMVNVYSTLKHFLKETVELHKSERREHARHLIDMKRTISKQQQDFFEEKFVNTVSERDTWATKCKLLQEEVALLRKERDDDLNKAKEEVAGAVRKIQQDEEEMQSIRALVTTVFRVSKEHEQRVQQLQSVLQMHRIAIPPKLVPRDRSVSPNPQSQPETQSPGNKPISPELNAPPPMLQIAGPPTKPTAAQPQIRKVTSDSHSTTPTNHQKGVSAVHSPRDTPPMAQVTMAPQATENSPGAGSEEQSETEESQRYAFVAPRIREQVSLEFLEASKRELEQCRLSTQQVLISSASESQSSYKLLVSSITAENQRLKSELQQQREINLQLEHYIHEKRFRQQAIEDAERDEALMAAIPAADREAKRRAIWNRDGSPAKRAPAFSLPLAGLTPKINPIDDVPRSQLTPRPAFPFEVQPKLGVDLKQPTGRIVSELAAVAVNLKNQLEEAQVRVRRLAACVGWMDEWTVNSLAEKDDILFLPTAPNGEWDNCHHFLRTNVHPHVINLKWPPAFTSYLISRFFDSYERVAEQARWERDSKMLAPRVYQPYERSLYALTKLDATQDEVKDSIANLPTGYVVTQFLLNELKSEARQNSIADLTQSHLGNPKFSYRPLDLPLENEFAKVAHNLWYAARKFRKSEPLCQLFLWCVEGRLPMSLYRTSTLAMEALADRVRSFDGARTGGVTYHQLTTAINSMLNDQAPDIWRGALFAAAQTLESKGIPLIGKIAVNEIISLESRTMPKKLYDLAISANNNPASGTPPVLAANAAVSSLPAAMQQNTIPVGASIFMKFVRRTIMQKYEAVYLRLETLCAPLIRESRVARGMSLLRISEAMEIMRQEDERVISAGGSAAAAVVSGILAHPGAPPPPQKDNNAHRSSKTASRNSPVQDEEVNFGVRVTSIANLGGDQSGAFVSPTKHGEDVDEVAPLSIYRASAIPPSIGEVVPPHAYLAFAGNYATNLKLITDRMFKYNSSVHFPVEGLPDGSDPNAKKDKDKKSGRKKSISRKQREALLEQLATEDQDWVEWYTFLHTMRSTTLSLPDLIFASLTSGTKISGDVQANALPSSTLR